MESDPRRGNAGVEIRAVRSGCAHRDWFHASLKFLSLRVQNDNLHSKSRRTSAMIDGKKGVEPSHFV